MTDVSGTRYVPTQKAFDDPGFLAGLLGEEEANRLMRPFTGEDRARVDAIVAQYGGSHAAALGVQDPELAAEVDALMARARQS